MIKEPTVGSFKFIRAVSLDGERIEMGTVLALTQAKIDKVGAVNLLEVDENGEDIGPAKEDYSAEAEKSEPGRIVQNSL